MRQTSGMQGVEIWNKINESAKIIAWPGVVAFGMVVFRAKLGGLFQRIRELITPAGSVKFDPAAQVDADLHMAASAGSLVETVRAEIEAATTADQRETASSPRAARTGGLVVAAASAKPELSEIKEEIEELIKASFVAGFQAARPDGHAKLQPPRPVVSWDGPTPRVRTYVLPTRDPHPVQEQLAAVESALSRATRDLRRARAEVISLEDKVEEAKDDPAQQPVCRAQLDTAVASRNRQVAQVAQLEADRDQLTALLASRPTWLQAREV